eukprot:CAMPEP_0184753500 /NCGR_PEP_ID=MMETSP0315-20130426/44136_1 /TAXON_ID=101924 /ORGANISM="Rhodosorus marinus, Strain UTEX LB 2760" /LENGTH=444 /DNA_ID=CAMNT_0027232881 /DNA_START=118 /DNA_END=1452 /DNA_ORIENTATION=-
MASNWRARVMSLYWERLLRGRIVDSRFEKRLVNQVRMMVRDPRRMAGVTEAGLNEFCHRFIGQSPGSRIETLTILGADLGSSTQEVALAVGRWNPRDKASLDNLRASITPAYIGLLQLLIRSKRGMEAVVQMRADLLRHEEKDESLDEMLIELSRLLRDWFSIGMMHIRRISMGSPADLLLKLMKYSRMYSPKPILSWEDMEKRLEKRRRIYAYFHPLLENEPLVYVEVALVGSGSVPASFLEMEQGQETTYPPTTAVFYAIASTQTGLRGLTLGEFLIRRVLDELSNDGSIGNLSRFVTLSPLPGFVVYLQQIIRSNTPTCLSREMIAAITRIGVQEDFAPRTGLIELNRTELEKLCFDYLLKAKRRRIRALDPVANFHLRNGASVLRLNWMADTEKQRLRESLGMCVNYEYDKDMIEENHRLYTLHGHIVQNGGEKADKADR